MNDGTPQEVVYPDPTELPPHPYRVEWDMRAADCQFAVGDVVLFRTYEITDNVYVENIAPSDERANCVTCVGYKYVPPPDDLFIN